MIFAIYSAIIIFCYVSGYYLSLYSLAVYIDQDDLEKHFPKLSKRRMRILRKLSDDPRAFTQIAIIYKSFVLIVISVSAFKVLQLLSSQFEISFILSQAVGMFLIWLGYIFVIEYLPRKFSRRSIDIEDVKFLWFITAVYIVFLPILKIYRHALRKNVEREAVSEEDKEEIIERAIETLADEAGIGESIVEEDEKEMIGNIFLLDQTIVKEIMIPRINITAIEKTMSFSDIKRIILRDGHSRYPVYEENIDKIIGLVYVKDIFNNMPGAGEEFDIEKYLRKPFLVPQTKIIGELLTEFQKNRLHIAIVMDEFGGVQGLVTLEDIIEEIFGEIRDEHDQQEQEEISKLADGTYLIDANLMLEKLQSYFDTDYEQGEHETLGGLIYDLVGSVPSEGQDIKWNSYEFNINKLDGQSIINIVVRDNSNKFD